MKSDWTRVDEEWDEPYHTYDFQKDMILAELVGGSVVLALLVLGVCWMLHR